MIELLIPAFRNFVYSLVLVILTGFLLVVQLPGKTVAEEELSRTSPLDTIESAQLFYVSLKPLAALQQADTSFSNKQAWAWYIPAFSFQLHNRFHEWAFGDEGGETQGIFRLDFGKSQLSDQDVLAILYLPMLTTLQLSLFAFCTSLILGMGLGFLLVRYENEYWTTAIQRLATGIYAFPVFFVAILLVLLFPGQQAAFLKEALGQPRESYISLYWLLAVCCLSYQSSIYIALQFRNTLSQVMRTDYILAARAKGLSNARIFWVHALPSAAFPIITYSGILLGSLFSGSFIIELVFGLQGTGLTLQDALLKRDLPVLSAMVLISGCMAVTGNFIADITYCLADPRIRQNSSST